ncbi:putative reverse transcriptase domain-containing protein [Tanacetum coccineum]
MVVSNLKKCLADASLHVPLDEIKVDKTLCFVEEPVEIIDREVKSLKRSKIALVKVCWNSKRGSEFTWEHEDYMKYPCPDIVYVFVIYYSMSPPIRRKYRASVAFATGCRRINKSRRGNRKIRVPIAMWPCRVEEKMTLKEVDGKTIQEFETKIIAKDGTITRVPGTFQGYETSEEESVERPRKRDLYEFVNHPQLQQRSHRNEFAPRRLSQPDGNMNGWLLEDEDEVERNEVDSDLESTASSKPVWEKTTKADRDLTNNVNNANNGNGGNGGGGNGNGGNNGCTFKAFQSCNPKEYDGKGGLRYLQSSSFVNKALTLWNTQVQARGRVAAMAMAWNDFKALMVEEFCPSNEMEKLENEFWNHKMVGANHAAYTDRFHELAKLVPHLVTPESSRIKRYLADGTEMRECFRATQPNYHSKCNTGGRDPNAEAVNNKRAKTGTGFVATAPTRNGTAKCGKCYTSHPENRPCNVCFNCQKPGHYARDCRAPVRQVAPVNAVRMSNSSRECYECGSPDHFRNTCPKLNRSPGQVGNQLALEGSRNNRSNGNQVRGRAYNVNVNAMEAVQDPNVVTGTFSLNDHFVTVLFDSGADFSFISTEFAPLLNVKPSIVNPGYVIEVADGKKVEVDRVIRDCKLELGSSLFSINLIPLGHGSFDVIVGMDWLSQHKAVIVCHEKVVEIPVEGGRILRVHGERAVGITKALKSAKEDEPKLNDISVVPTLIAKSPYRLAPSEMQELSGQLQELQDKGFYMTVILHGGAPVVIFPRIGWESVKRVTIDSLLMYSSMTSYLLKKKERTMKLHLGLVLGILKKEEVVCQVLQV